MTSFIPDKTKAVMNCFKQGKSERRNKTNLKEPSKTRFVVFDDCADSTDFERKPKKSFSPFVEVLFECAKVKLLGVEGDTRELKGKGCLS